MSKKGIKMACCRALGDKIPARFILCFMLITCTMVAYLQRVHLSVAIIAMVRINSTSRPAIENISTECYQEANVNEQFKHKVSTTASEDLYDWTEFQQSIILSSFYWGYILLQVIGGGIADRWGIKIVLGYSLLINGLLGLVIPFAASVHWTLILAVRSLQGLTQGPLFPCVNVAAGRWVPPNERQTFISFIEQGVSLGNLSALLVCGWILTRWSWPQVFYMSGCVALTWCITWYFLAYSSPSTHPRISTTEKSYLKSILPHTENISKMSVPWIAVLKSPQFWVGFLAMVGHSWGFCIYINFGPKYMKTALGFDLEKSSWLASLPFLSQLIFTVSYAVFCQVLLERKITSKIFIRKMSVSITHMIPAMGMIALTQVGCNAVMSIVILIVCVSAVGGISCGFFQNPLDIAPNFAGSLTGLANAAGALTIIISTPITGAILQTAGYTKGWKIIFGLTACLYILTGLPYLLIATAKLQSWNNPGKNQSKQNELEALQGLTLKEYH